MRFGTFVAAALTAMVPTAAYSQARDDPMHTAFFEVKIRPPEGEGSKIGPLGFAA